METKKIAGTIYTLLLDDDLQTYRIAWQRGERWGYADYASAYAAMASWTRLN